MIVTIKSPEGSLFATCPCGCGKSGAASSWFYGITKCEKGATQEWLDSFQKTEKEIVQQKKKGAPKKSAGDSSKAPTPTKDTDHSSDALTADDESTKQKPAKKPKLTQEAKEKKAKKAKPAAEEGAEPKQKRPQSAYFLFCASKRAASSEKTLSAKELGEMWKAATEEEKAPFEKEAAAAKAEYDATKGPSESEKKKAAKDAGPKKARSAYMIYTAHTRQQVNEEFPGIKMTEAAKLMGTRWKELSPEDKKKWEDMAKAEKESIAAGGERPDTTDTTGKRKAPESDEMVGQADADEADDAADVAKGEDEIPAKEADVDAKEGENEIPAEEADVDAKEEDKCDDTAASPAVNDEAVTSQAEDGSGAMEQDAEMRTED